DDRLDVLDLACLEEDVADGNEQRPLVDRVHDRLVVFADNDLEVGLRLVEVADRGEVVPLVDNAVTARIDGEETREDDRLRDRDVLVHDRRPGRSADDPPHLVADGDRHLPPALPPRPDPALPPHAGVLGEPLLRFVRHGCQGVIDEVRGVGEDGELGAVVEEVAHAAERRGPRGACAMKAMVLGAAGAPLEAVALPDPEPKEGQVLLRVHACGVCRTDLHVVDGELPAPKLPLVVGHQIVGEVLSDGVVFGAGERIGVPWLGWTCGVCRFCKSERENLCDVALFTGYTVDGGYAELCVADERFCFPIPEGYPDLQAAPLLCAGLIGYRAYRMAGDAETLGFYGFGAAAHILCQLAV